MNTWDGYDVRQLELTKLQGMTRYARKEYFAHQDHLEAQYNLSSVRGLLAQHTSNEKLLAHLAKKHLRLYDESNSEDEWKIAEEYLALAKHEQDSKQAIRASLVGRQEAVRKARVEWEKVKKMVALKEKLKHS